MIQKTIQLGKHKYIGAPTSDEHLSLPLVSSTDLLDDQDLFRTVSALQQAQDERNACTSYRLHGTINTLSFLTNRPTEWTSLQNLVVHAGATSLNTDFELCVGYIEKYVPIRSLGTGYYEQRMRLLATGDAIDLIPCGFAQNVFTEPQINFVLNGLVDVGNLVSTGLPVDWPVTDLVYYLRPRGTFYTLVPTTQQDTQTFDPGTEQGYVPGESTGTQGVLATSLATYIKPTGLAKLSDATWVDFVYPQVDTLFQLADVRMTPANVILNKTYISDWVGVTPSQSKISGENPDADGLIPIGVTYFDSTDLTFRQVSRVQYGLTRTMTQTLTTSTQSYIRNLGYQYSILSGNTIRASFDFAYEPTKLLRIRDFSGFVERGNPADTADIPAYAVSADDGSGDYLWRDLLSPGFMEPTTDNGVSFPFVSGNHYPYTSLVYAIGPDLSNYNSFRAFSSAKRVVSAPSFSF
jgi:hypothetical protein